jgi:predicted Zn-dependent protease
MKNIFLAIMLLAFTGFWILIAKKEGAPGEASFAPLFQVLGKGPQTVSRTLTKALPVDSIDEGELGNRIAARHSVDSGSAADRKTQAYLESLVKGLEAYKKKPFTYRVFLIEGEPNAMAMPGGVILVTRGIMKILHSESELMGVLGHEFGHIELSHCFEAVKFELLSRKFSGSSLGEIADFAQSVLFRSSYSKTQEDEADQYGYQFLQESPYDPAGLARSFVSLAGAGPRPGRLVGLDPLHDYLISHPPLEMRISRFSEQSKHWWQSHPHERRYLGKRNFEERTPLTEKRFQDCETVNGFTEEPGGPHSPACSGSLQNKAHRAPHSPQKRQNRHSSRNDRR